MFTTNIEEDPQVNDLIFISNYVGGTIGVNILEHKIMV
jgi:hypothetical protein